MRYRSSSARVDNIAVIVAQVNTKPTLGQRTVVYMQWRHMYMAWHYCMGQAGSMDSSCLAKYFVTPQTCEHFGTRVKEFALGAGHISDFFS